MAGWEACDLVPIEEEMRSLLDELSPLILQGRRQVIDTLVAFVAHAEVASRACFPVAGMQGSSLLFVIADGASACAKGSMME